MASPTPPASGPSEDSTLLGSKTVVPDDEPRSGDTVEHFCIVEEIGKGAMGVVFRARDTVLGRDVALKLLNPTRAANAERRLLREAQAMAQLSHPNVVTVHAVGRYANGVYIAMELVRGDTLTDWLDQAPRSWVEAVQVWTAAGDGLAAAHAAGLVHRDFKPDNVLVREDGQVLVTDFGLAGVDEDGTPTPDDGALELGEPLTRTGMVMGTPRYMSPEQMCSFPADARADQFAFAVSLYRAVYGEYPFDGDTLVALREAVVAGKPKPPASGTAVPRRIWGLLERALRADPDDRFPDMTALIVALRDVVRTPARRRRYALVGLLAAGALGGGLAMGLGFEPAPCQRLGDRLDGIWDEPRSEALSAALLGLPGTQAASQTLERVKPRLDSYAVRWVDTAREVCEATHLHGLQSEALLAARVRCLDGRREALRALVSVLVERVDATVLEHSVEAADGLPAIDACPDAALETAAAAESPEVEARLAELAALRRVGQYALAIERAEALMDALHTPRGRARALLLRARSNGSLGEHELAESQLIEAAYAAAEAGDDLLVADAQIALVDAAVFGLERMRDAAVLLEAARIAMRRAGDPPRLRYRAANIAARLHQAREEFSDALAQYQLALDAAADRSAGSTAVASLLAQRSISYAAVGRFDDALADANKALELRRQLLGEEHPDVTASIKTLGRVLVMADRNGEGIAAFEHARDRVTKRAGPDALPLAPVLFDLANAQLMNGDVEAGARSAERALSLLEQHGQGQSQKAASTRGALSAAYGMLGKHDQALALIEQTIAAREKTYSPDDPALTFDLHLYGKALRHAKRCEKAVPVFERLGKLAPRGSQYVGFAATGVGLCLMELARPAAREALETTLELEEPELETHERAVVLFSLAQLHDRSGESAKASARANEALALADTPGSAELRDGIKAWLAAHGG